MKRAAVTCWLVLSAGATPAAAPGQGDTTARIVGTVRSALDGLPLAGVTVAARGGLVSGVSNAAGSFALGGLPSGRQTVRILYLDTLSYDQEITLQPGTTLALAVVLDVDALELTPLVVDVKSPRAERSLVGFFDRKTRGLGHFYTLADLDRLGVLTPQVLLTQAGVTVRCRLRRCVPFVLQESGPCIVSLFVNGMNVATDYLEVVHIDELVGVEVYLHAVDVPAKFRPHFGTAECGAVLLWTRY